jgi:glutamate N-acetyltransferase/amino-acid N-acetyltransferase
MKNFTEIEGATGAPKGFYATGLASAIKSSGEKDVGLIYSPQACKAAAVFTRNKVFAAPVKVSRERIENKIHGIIVNSGNANACTGDKGVEDAIRMTQIVEDHFGLPNGSFLVCSTGIIGHRLPMHNVEYGINKICKNLFSPHQSSDSLFTEAIMTTDKRKKEIALRVKLSNNQVIKIGASAKGAGMIAPNMATMLCFITTDANIDRDALQSALTEVSEETFNCITIDGDMSTNDTVLLLANATAENDEIKSGTPEYDTFKDALLHICGHLSRLIVKDGEGSSKIIHINVKNAKTKSDAKKIGDKIANSLLFKTACFGQDPNWGRILAAAGSVTDAQIDVSKLDLYIGEQLTLKNGELYEAYVEADAASYMKKKELEFTLDLKLGDAFNKVMTCDISFEYVRINSAYKT